MPASRLRSSAPELIRLHSSLSATGSSAAASSASSSIGARKATPACGINNTVTCRAGSVVHGGNSAPIYVTGVSMYLPTPTDDQDPVDRNNYKRLTNGDRLQRALDDSEVVALYQEHLSRVAVTPSGEKKRVPLRLSDVSKVVGRAPVINLSDRYGIPESVCSSLNSASKMAVVAGLEALRDAGINLMKESPGIEESVKICKNTSSVRPLPIHLQSETGIVYASVWTGIAAAIKESHALMEGKLHELFSNPADPSGHEVHEFDRRLMFKTAVLANQQLAEMVKAKGPCFQINYACASTTAAVSLAEDLIRSGRCNRVIVLGADNSTAKVAIDTIMASFQAIGVLSPQADPLQAGMPFDSRRQGMILSAGAVALVLETEAAAKARNAFQQLSESHNGHPTKYAVQLIKTCIANSAYHGTDIDSVHIGCQLDQLLKEVQECESLTRDELSKQLFYVSHDAGSKGGVNSEMEALHRVFGDSFHNLQLTNTKWMTGHAVGASFEETASVMALRTGILPALPSSIIPDPKWKIDPSQFAEAGKETKRRFALRFGAGLGSQMVYTMYKRVPLTTTTAT